MTERPNLRMAFSESPNCLENRTSLRLKDKILSHHKPRLLLHIGPHKTGSTAIQNSLQLNANILKAHGWQYMNFRFLQNGAHQVADSLHVGHFANIENRVRTALETTDNVIVSSENFSRLAPPQAQRFLGCVSQHQVEVLFYARNPIERVISQWRELIKHGYSRSYDAFFRNRALSPVRDHEINDTRKLSAWVDSDPPTSLKVRIFDNADDIVEDFWKYFIGIENAKLRAGPKRANASNDMYMTEVMRALQGHQIYLARDSQIMADAADLARLLKSISDADQQELITYNMSMDQLIFRMLERSLYAQFGNSIAPSPINDILFPVRSSHFAVVNPDIWLRHPPAYQRLQAIKERLQQAYGTPRIDKRLLSL